MAPRTALSTVVEKRDNSKWRWCIGREMMMTVQKDKAYVTGGWIQERAIDDKSVNNVFSNPDLFVFDFSKDTDISDFNNFGKKLPLPLETVPAMKWGSFWSLGDDTDKILLSQGELEYYRLVDSSDHNSTLKIQRNPAAGKVFEYTPSKDSWKALPKPADLTNSVSKIATTFSKKANKGFFFGGQIWQNAYLDRGETRVGRHTTGINAAGNSPQDRFVSYDAETNTWTNSTSDIPHTEFATLTALDNAGGDGLLVLLGGQQGAEEHQGGDGPPQWRTMDSVAIHDIASGKWYNQPTTAEGGFYPDKRTLHCSVAVSAPDGSSHNIYMFGGQSENNKRFLRDVWVLSIPSFHWINLKADIEAGISDMACGVVGEKYLFAFGGKDTVTPLMEQQVCDSQTGGRLLDLSTGKWDSKFEAGEEYSVPEAVYSVIGGDKKGGATMVEPKKGFVDESLKELLKIKKVDVPSQSNPTKPALADGSGSSDSSNSGGSSDKSSGLRGGAIAGIVVGVIAAIALIALVLFLVKRKNKRNGHHGVPSSGSSGVNELDSGNATAPGQPVEYYTYKQPLAPGTEYSDSSAAAPHEKDGTGTVRSELPSEERQYHEMDSTGSRR